MQSILATSIKSPSLISSQALLFAPGISKSIISNSEVIRSGSTIPSIFITINSLGISSILSELLSLQLIVLYESTTILVIVLFDSLIVLTIILLGALNSNIVLSSIPELRAVSFLSELTLGFLDSLAILIAVLCNYLASTNVLSSSLTQSSSILSDSLSELTTTFLVIVLSSLSLGAFTLSSISLPIQYRLTNIVLSSIASFLISITLITRISLLTNSILLFTILILLLSLATSFQ